MRKAFTTFALTLACAFAAHAAPQSQLPADRPLFPIETQASGLMSTTEEQELADMAKQDDADTKYYYGNKCCTNYGWCYLNQWAPVGYSCYCYSWGWYYYGRVCY